eukprot:CAMPEP_0115881968 /NCGR_PEP_ID=MMETSP0287-20121206/28741_1 /TAXON_ID=412157 /ORGANISM="Chrysochromulina rotalis, Strain UIO044" /LENGTH=226 /DNA_ID=CAMNT_0003337989 /DNA_START=570 /DNA_END=1246 /DNA_ORIENTATION=-
MSICLCWLMGKLHYVYLKIEATPENVEKGKSSTKMSEVKVEGAGGDVPVATSGMATHAKLMHVLSVIVAAVIALFVGIVLADGTSVIKLKDARHLKVVTNPALKSQGLHHRLDELLGPTYGVGLHHDQAGFTWTDVHAGSTLKEILANLGVAPVIAALPSVIATDDLKHPVPFLECKELQMSGLTAVSFGFIAETVAVLMLIFHVVALAGLIPMRLGKPAAALVWG